ncbi:MAG: sporulation transcriptional regulator SpoIIID [Candidatus Nomurabacteria bacterium]|jgi:putative DeoR family transcriptional regulator (stage III sporulation protein D)|nr:sporulation transcriptional regulator SpoIIID [Candidatus Nomurabacteria bacterium]
MSKKQELDDRCVKIGEYVADTGCTVREAAKEFDISKSTVHKDLTERLPKVKPQIANDAARRLLSNKRERHLRGGEATKRKWQELTSRGKAPAWVYLKNA